MVRTTDAEPPSPTSPHSGNKSAFSAPMICTDEGHRILTIWSKSGGLKGRGGGRFEIKVTAGGNSTGQNSHGIEIRALSVHWSTLQMTSAGI